MAGPRVRSSPRMQRRRDATRIAILRAAGRIFRERGFAETSMRDIAAAADLSVANLYHHFSGKDEILFFCQDRSLDLMLAAVAEARRLPDGPAPRLRHVLRAHAGAVLDEVEGAVAHVATEALSDPLRRRIVAKRDRYEHAVRELVGACVVNRESANGDVAVLTRAMLGALNWTVTWFRPDGEQSASAVADTIANYLIRGVEDMKGMKKVKSMKKEHEGRA
jgi:TetR/AcrR family transcriptional regulator, cholesterol catabolism regulator